MCRRVMDYASDAILIADARGRVLQANRRACELIGRSRHELLGSTSIDLAPEADRKRLATKVYYLSDGGELLTATSLSAANGEMVPIELSARRIDDSTSGETFFLAILPDNSSGER